jgi:hypothetical protein
MECLWVTECTTHATTISPMTTTAPTSHQSQVGAGRGWRLEVGELLGAGAVVVWVAGGCALGAGAGLAEAEKLGTLMLLLGARLLIALLTPLPHPATSNPAARTANEKTTLLVRPRMAESLRTSRSGKSAGRPISPRIGFGSGRSVTRHGGAWRR